MSRLPPLKKDKLTVAQSEVYNAISAGARGGVRGPFTVLLHSPELARRVEQLGVYVRFQCSIPQRLRELAIVIVAAHWQADYEWYAHSMTAENNGISASVLQAIGSREAPDFSDDADRVVYDYVRELLEAGHVSEPVFGRAQALLGDGGVVDLTGIAGYYSLLAMTLNAFEVAVPDDGQVPWRTSAGSEEGA